jgi:hypothetical protein
VRPLACIVGEPTGMVPALAHKGVYRWRCCVKGHAAHSSLTPQAVNAVEVGARVINKLADMSERWRDHEPRYAGFDVPYSTGAVCVVEGGIADNVVPEDCRFHYEFRNLPNADVAAMQREVEAYAEGLEPSMRAIDPQAGIRFETICAVPAFLARPTIRRCASRSASPRPMRPPGRVRHRGRPVPGRRHPDRGLRTRPHRAGAPGRRVRLAGPARRGRALPAGARRQAALDRAAAALSARGDLLHRFSESRTWHARSDGSASAGWARRW